MPEQNLVKLRGRDTPSTLIGKKVIVTQSWYHGYKVGDIYHVSEGQWCPRLLRQEPDGSLTDIYATGFDAEFALCPEQEQLEFKFLSDQHWAETLDW